MDFNITGVSPKPGSLRQNNEPVDVLILGSGPAGMAAALYAARADLNPVVLTGMELGGQVSLTYTVENYPGFPDGVGGQQLVELFQKQAERFGTRVEYDTAVEVDLSRQPFYVRTYSGEYQAKTLIITTGATPIHLNVPGETELTGRGVSYCATCDGWFFKEKDVVVIGGGDSALEEGIFLTRYAKSITIVLVDVVEGMPQGKALDLQEALPVIGKDVTVTGSNDYDATSGSDIIVITAGLPRKPGMSRDDLLAANAEIVRKATEETIRRSPEAIYVILTNPLDAMAFLAMKVAR